MASERVEVVDLPSDERRVFSLHGKLHKSGRRATERPSERRGKIR